MSDLIFRAAAFAAAAHQGQVRKYGNVPYIVHPSRVAGRVLTLPSNSLLSTDWLVAVALLHDVAEDCDVTFDTLRSEFGSVVSDGVYWLTNASRGSEAPRHERKAADRAHIAAAPPDIRRIKLLDRIDNLRDLPWGGMDESFVRLYCEESRLLLDALRGTDAALENEMLLLIADRIPVPA